MQALSKAKLRLFRSLRGKKHRHKEGLFLVEGEKLVREAIHSDFELEGCVLREDVWEDHFDSLTIDRPSIPIWKAAPEEYSEMSTLETSEGIIAVVRLPKRKTTALLPEGPGFILDSLQDPGNVGTILRVADWFGMPHVLYTSGTVDLWNPKTLRASMGAIFRVKTYKIERIEEFVSQFAERIWLADMEGLPLSGSNLKGTDYFLLGNEAQGISSNFKEHPHLRKVQIPGSGGGESLNVSVAAGILAYELHRGDD